MVFFSKGKRCNSAERASSEPPSMLWRFFSSGECCAEWAQGAFTLVACASLPVFSGLFLLLTFPPAFPGLRFQFIQRSFPRCRPESRRHEDLTRPPLDRNKASVLNIALTNASRFFKSHLEFLFFFISTRLLPRRCFQTSGARKRQRGGRKKP